MSILLGSPSLDFMYMSASAPEAPPLSETTTGCFIRLFFWMADCIIRAIWSDAPPAPAATTISTGLFGSQATAGAVASTMASAAVAPRQVGLISGIASSLDVRAAGQKPAPTLLICWRAFCRFAAAAQVRRRPLEEPRPLVARSPRLGPTWCARYAGQVVQTCCNTQRTPAKMLFSSVRGSARDVVPSQDQGPVNGQQQGEAAMENSRRDVMAGACAVAAMTFSPAALAAWEPSQRYPDPAIQSLDPSFNKYDRAC